ncbi:imidazoleglycerol-phosphate dehydratase HisB [Balneolaceae bacterium ANBcel3]|nr:imidazoleglycerol-phosphate dehydratase HisB [Balneolaceae bacterium ANBcel3]
MSFSDIVLSIELSALQPSEPRFLMAQGALFNLKRLSAAGFTLTGDRKSYPEPVQRLLEQEEINWNDVADTSKKQIVIQSASGDTLHISGDTDTGSFEGWQPLADHLLSNRRTASHSRKTAETDIVISVDLDGSGKSSIDTGLPFYDHMLEQISRHGYIDMEIRCKGDLHIDEHHTIEDTAIALGETIAKALGDKRGIGRYGFMVAMDETRSLAAIDLSGRPWCVFEGTFSREKVGEFPTEMTSHFFHSFAMALKATLHVAVKGTNDHHQIEACFKSLARALRQAVDRNEKYLDILPSSKGLL